MIMNKENNKPNTASLLRRILLQVIPIIGIIVIYITITEEMIIIPGMKPERFKMIFGFSLLIPLLYLITKNDNASLKKRRK